MTDSFKSPFPSVVTALPLVFLLFIGGIAVLMVVVSPSLKATPVTKGLVVVLAGSVVGGAISTLMWSIRWQRIAPEVRASQLAAGASPTNPDSLLAWRWRRRFRVCWILTMLTMAAIVLSETLAGHW